MQARITEAMPAPNYLDCHTCLSLPQKFNDLLFVVLAWFAYPCLLRVDELLGKVIGAVYGEQVTTIIWRGEKFIC